jgi:hypothetical protein
MDEEQQRRFKQAVERKAQQSEDASHATDQGRAAERAGVRGDQESLRSASQVQDEMSPREKNTRHKKVTADKWNQ